MNKEEYERIHTSLLDKAEDGGKEGAYALTALIEMEKALGRKRLIDELDMDETEEEYDTEEGDYFGERWDC